MSLKICDLWLSCPEDITCGWKTFTKPIEWVINQFPIKINPYWDTGKYYKIDEYLTIVYKLSLLKNSVEISKLTRGLYVSWTYIFVVGNFLGELFVIDTYVIREELDGNGNGAIITFGKVKHCVQWLLKLLHLSGVREDSMQEIIKISISSDVTSNLEDDESSHTLSNLAYKISKPQPDNVSENMDDAKYVNLTAAEKKTFSLEWPWSRNTGENTVSYTSQIWGIN